MPDQPEGRNPANTTLLRIASFSDIEEVSLASLDDLIKEFGDTL
jgi:hypothetical protein